MLKIMDLDGNIKVDSNDDKDFKEKVRLFIEELIEDELLDKSPTKMHKKNLKLLFQNGYVLEQDGVLSGNSSSLKWYFRFL